MINSFSIQGIIAGAAPVVASYFQYRRLLSFFTLLYLQVYKIVHHHHPRFLSTSVSSGDSEDVVEI